jgi:hypothetical protein
MVSVAIRDLELKGQLEQVHGWLAETETRSYEAPGMDENGDWLWYLVIPEPDRAVLFKLTWM